MPITEGCTACLESDDVKVTRIYFGGKWMKVEKPDGTAEWVRAVVLKEKIVESETVEEEEAP